jgi:hypothetical protein
VRRFDEAVHHDWAAVCNTGGHRHANTRVFTGSGGIGADGMMLAAGWASVRSHDTEPRIDPMKKLALNVDALEVQSFPVSADAGERGTVMAHSGWTNCGELTCLLSLCPDCIEIGTR